ncbi:MAG: GNAT family N-acetyltransferase [Phycisphaerae bacterium]|nr:GNAT family N-acetyltransferase [Phycisphaerae bacterium]MBM91891.1 GNAT family N-acetyltransferase [Phycisphaerae bacterium]|tara:strand:- start:1546 stop:2046 length:501 start_codon:yes stop_codon:yes gene_type:complete
MATQPGIHSFDIRDLTPEDKHWVQRVLVQYWGSTVQITRGQKFQADELPGLVAQRDGSEVGLLTYHIKDNECEVITHNSMAGHGGIGSCLLDAVRTKAREQGCKRLWLITTNDNTPALRFYQRREFDLVGFYRNAVTEARKLKPEIPNVGFDGIPIRHEIELEYPL